MVRIHYKSEHEKQRAYRGGIADAVKGTPADAKWTQVQMWKEVPWANISVQRITIFFNLALIQSRSLGLARLKQLKCPTLVNYYLDDIDAYELVTGYSTLGPHSWLPCGLITKAQPTPYRVILPSNIAHLRRGFDAPSDVNVPSVSNSHEFVQELLIKSDREFALKQIEARKQKEKERVESEISEERDRQASESVESERAAFIAEQEQALEELRLADMQQHEQDVLELDQKLGFEPTRPPVELGLTMIDLQTQDERGKTELSKKKARWFKSILKKAKRHEINDSTITLTDENKDNKIMKKIKKFFNGKKANVVSVSKINDYEILTNLTANNNEGANIIAHAKRRSDSTDVVLKLFRATTVWHWHVDDNGNRMPMEAYVLQRMSECPDVHPAIVKYYDYFDMGSSCYCVVMEYLGGGAWVDLFQYIDEYAPVEEIVAWKIFSRIVDVVLWLKSRGVVHNDIKDENIMINKDTLEIKLIDFGSATHFYTGMTTNKFCGTIKFASPEAHRGRPYQVEKQEVWALGTVFFILLLRNDPFATKEEALGIHINDRVVAFEDQLEVEVSQAAADALEAMMDPDFRKRVNLSQIPDLIPELEEL
ncbi:kinase-like domain-containing protein [Gaertneriomyces semiglobifer]|nr:kinase-like domain-containing protein [Gaertneriomyces semiglobifer]